jgi:hypothetical protein
MAFWGIVTAASRIVYFERAGIGEFFVRAANWGIPVVIYVIWNASSEKKFDKKA